MMLNTIFRLIEGFSVLYLAKRYNPERALLISAESESLNNISFVTIYKSNHHEILKNRYVYIEEPSSIIIERILVCSIVICAFFVQLLKCMRVLMELKILTGTLGALIGEHPYGSE